jgi:hypothetical protein
MYTLTYFTKHIEHCYESDSWDFSSPESFLIYTMDSDA